MKNTDPLPVAIWALDPHETSLVPSPLALNALKGFKLIPVSVSPTHAPLDYQRMNAYLNACCLIPIESPHLLSTRAHGPDAVQMVIDFAKQHHASVIALTSHGRSGLERLFLGSFAERLLDHSPIPVLFMTTHRNLEPKPPNRALFATSFSPESKAAFQKFLKFAGHSTVEIVLFHTNETQAQAYSSYGLAGLPYPINDEIASELSWEEEEAKQWVSEMSKTHPHLRLHSLISGNCSAISSSIHELCEKEKIGLVGVAVERSALERVLFGSVARPLFRQQTTLVWVSPRSES